MKFNLNTTNRSGLKLADSLDCKQICIIIYLPRTWGVHPSAIVCRSSTMSGHVTQTVYTVKTVIKRIKKSITVCEQIDTVFLFINKLQV